MLQSVSMNESCTLYVLNLFGRVGEEKIHTPAGNRIPILESVAVFFADGQLL